MLVLLAEAVDDRAEPAAVQTDPEQEQQDHQDRQAEHHHALGAVGEDVRMGAAEHHVDHQHHRRDDERPDGFHAEHDLEHHEAGDQLPGQIEEQHQREHRDDHADAVGLEAVAEVLGNRAVAEAVASGGDQAHGDEHAEVDADGIEEVAPHGGEPPFVGEARPAQERGAAGGGGGEREGKEHRPVAAARGGEIVGVLHPPLAKHADGEHRADVEHEEQPRPSDERHGASLAAVASGVAPSAAIAQVCRNRTHRGKVLVAPVGDRLLPLVRLWKVEGRGRLAQVESRKRAPMGVSPFLLRLLHLLRRRCRRGHRCA